MHDQGLKFLMFDIILALQPVEWGGRGGGGGVVLAARGG